MRTLLLIALASFCMAAAAAPAAVPTFHSLGLYWSPQGGAESNPAKVEFREAGASSWRRGLDLWFDARNAEYRGSLVELKPGTEYEVKVTLGSGASELIRAKTWSENFKIKRTVQVPAGTKHLVIKATDSGDEKEGYVLFTAPPGQNVIDQSEVAGNQLTDSCVWINQGTHHVIIRGLVLKNCKRAGIYLDRQYQPVLDTQTRDIVIEDNEFVGWGGFDNHKPGRNIVDNDGAVYCGYYRETEDAKRPSRIIVQRNVFRDPRHGATPWQAGAGPRVHPEGPQALLYVRCGTNHVIRYNDVYSKNGNYFMDGFGGAENFSAGGFPFADSDIYGNRISQVYDDAIEAEGGNRNVRIWGNYVDEVFIGIGNAATATGPLYVWRNVSNQMARMYSPNGDPDMEQRGPFIKAGSNHKEWNGGRAYYFHNTILQPPGKRYTYGAGWGIQNSGGKLTNFVSRNNIWQIHKEVLIHGQPKFYAISANDEGIDADFDLHNAPIVRAGVKAQRRGWEGRAVYASSGGAYPNLKAQPGNFQLKAGSPGFQAAEPIPNFNDGFGARADIGAHQSGTPPMRFGREAGKP